MNGMAPTPCPICEKTAKYLGTISTTDTGDWACDTCGKFEITRQTMQSVTNELRPYLSAATRQATEVGQKLKLTIKNFVEVAQSHQRTTVSEKLAKLITFLGARTRVPGGWHIIRFAYDYPLVDGQDEDELKFCLNYLQQTSQLTVGTTGGGPGEAKYQLTVDGWRQLEPTLRPGGEPGRCFVISWLADEMDEPYRKGIEPAVRACGYTPVWMKDIPENKGITDRILSEIRRAEFVVADFSGERPNAYFEAGFAKGLGREIIWCCREADVGKLHFDIRHYGFVVWKDSDDLRQRLEDTIRANVIKPA